MDVHEEGEVQFRCKLCNFAGTVKSEIAEHFLSEHIAVEYVSPKKKASTSVPEKESENDIKEERDGIEEKTSPKKRGRPKKRNLDSITSKPSAAAPEPTDSREETEQLGRGMRKKKKKISINVVSSEKGDEDVRSRGENEIPDDGEDEDDDFAVDEDDIDSGGWLSDDGCKDKMKRGKTIMIQIKPLKFKSRGRGRPRKHGKGGGQREDQNWSAFHDLKSKKGGSLRTNLRVPTSVFNNIIRDRVRDWQRVYEEKHTMDLYRCEVERCKGAGMPEAEFDIHMKCHVANMEGFRCFICQFVCLHWRNMRHHYRKVHDQMLSKVTCEVEGCEKEFPKIAGLRSHMMIMHIRPPILEKLSSEGSDISEFASYLEKHKGKRTEPADSQENVNNTSKNDQDLPAVQNVEAIEEGEEEVQQKRGRGRPPKLKRPTGRPSKEPPRKKQNYQRRLQGEDREKFQRRLVAFVCEVCNAKYHDETMMLEHKYKHFPEEGGSIHCTECDSYVTQEESSIRFHMISEHKNMLQLHRCNKCNFSSNRYHDLKKHHIVHTGAKNYMCDKCGKCTTTPYNLKVHYRRMHATDDEKNISCMTCDYKCADKAVLKDHIRQKHGMLVNGDEYTNPRSMLLFPCPTCSYVGRKQSSLDYHMRIHNENRQFKCHLCPYASKTKNNLVLHLRTHDGMRPMKCPQCDFRGATKKIISEHVMCKHAKARPYQCNICGWSTAYSGNMWKHVDNHQKELGDKMPEFPVEVISTDGLVPAPLRAPTGKKRGLNKGSNFKLKLMKTGNKSRRQQQSQPPQKIRNPAGGITILEERTANVQTVRMPAGANIPEGVVMQVPVHSVVGPNGQVMVTEGLAQEESIGSTALSRLAAAVASAQEVHIIQANDGIDRGSQHEQQIIATQIEDGIPTSIHVGSNSGMHQEIIEYTVPSVAQQILTSSGDITEVITSDHHYHAVHNPNDQSQQIHHQPQQQSQQQHQQHHQHGSNSGSSIQQAAIHAGISTSNGSEQVPTAVVEQIVQDTPAHHEDQTVVHNLVASMIPHDAELVMSMMQIQQVPQVQQVQHVHHVQQPNVSQ